MRWMGLDWKFFISIVIAIAGLAIPIYFWQADLTAHSLTVRLVSVSALQPPAESGIQDLQVTVNGTKIDSPYIFSLVLVNTGSKPISSSDFETPLELSTRNDSKLITAQVTKTDPEDIPAKILIESSRLKILPFLSNPKDQISITVVSSGAPDFAAKARIAGVKGITYEDMTRTKLRPGAAILASVLSVSAIALYVFFFVAGPMGSSIRITMPVRLVTAFCMGFAALYFTEQFSLAAGRTHTAYGILGTLCLCGLGLGLLLSRNARKRSH